MIFLKITCKRNFKEIIHLKNIVTVKILKILYKIFAIKSSNILSNNIRSRVNNYSLLKHYFIVG